MEPKKEKVKIANGKINYSCLMGDCPSSCCGPFGGVQSGLDSVNGTEFSEITLTTNDSDKIINAGYAHLIELTEKDYYRMKLKPDSACVAFIDGKCSIHSIKPSICKAFPFYIDMFVGLCTVSGSCPGCGGDGWTDLKDISEEISSAKDMYDFWLRNIQK
jgi:hypothetical protein